jgi:hypothetical protein
MQQQQQEEQDNKTRIHRASVSEENEDSSNFYNSTRFADGVLAPCRFLNMGENVNATQLCQNRSTAGTPICIGDLTTTMRRSSTILGMWRITRYLIVNMQRCINEGQYKNARELHED